MPPRKPIKATKKPTTTANNDAGALVENGSVPENRSLKPREAELFRDCLTKYENKEYTQGLEKAEEVLKVKPDHGGEFLPFLSLPFSLEPLVDQYVLLRGRVTVYEGSLLLLSRQETRRIRNHQERSREGFAISHRLACLRDRLASRQALGGSPRLLQEGVCHRKGQYSRRRLSLVIHHLARILTFLRSLGFTQSPQRSVNFNGSLEKIRRICRRSTLHPPNSTSISPKLARAGRCTISRQTLL